MKCNEELSVQKAIGPSLSDRIYTHYADLEQATSYNEKRVFTQNTTAVFQREKRQKRQSRKAQRSTANDNIDERLTNRRTQCNVTSCTRQVLQFASAKSTQKAKRSS